MPPSRWLWLFPIAALIASPSGLAQIIDVRVNGDADQVVTSITQSETTIAVGNGFACVAFNDRMLPLSRTGFAVSASGVSFSDGGTFPTPSPEDHTDPFLGYRQADGQFYFVAMSSTSAGLVVLRSPNCQTWTFLGRINRDVQALAESDRPMLAIDNSNGSSRFGRLYVAFIDPPQLLPTAPVVRVAWSENPASPPEPANTWSNISDVADPVPGWRTQSPWLAVAPNGDVYVAFAEYQTAHGGQQIIRISRSTDGGMTWEPRTPIATGRRAGNSAASDPERCGRPALNGDIRISGSMQIAVDDDPSLPPPGYVIHASYFYDSDGTGADESNVFYR